MNTAIRYAVIFGAAAFIAPAWGAADAGSARPERKEMRVITSTDHPRPGPRRPLREVEKETVAFLGVQASPVSRTLTVQLGLPEGAGLVVNEIAPGSPAAGVLQEHDILLKLDDQLLIETRQLAVLVRQHKEGDEVTLTYLRAGKQATARVKLGQHEVPKMSGWFEQPFPGAAMGAFGGGSIQPFGPDAPREEVDRVLSLLQHSRQGGPVRIQIERRNGPGVNAMSVNAGNSSLVFSDNAGSLELTIKDGAKSLVAKDHDGKELFSGPVNTPAERQAMPRDVRARLEQLEGMRDLTFHTDADFKGPERRIIQPLGRGISVPPAPPATPPRLPQFL